jgi:hypothetical protein
MIILLKVSGLMHSTGHPMDVGYKLKMRVGQSCVNDGLAF